MKSCHVGQMEKWMRKEKRRRRTAEGGPARQAARRAAKVLGDGAWGRGFARTKERAERRVVRIEVFMVDTLVLLFRAGFERRCDFLRGLKVRRRYHKPIFERRVDREYILSQNPILLT